MPPKPTVSQCVFGVPLETAIETTAKTLPGVPDVVVYCVSYILRFGLEEVGIFRIPGRVTEVQALKEVFQRGNVPAFDVTSDPSAIAMLLKQYIRDLPVPIFQRVQNVQSSGNPYRDIYNAIDERYKTTAFLLLYLFHKVRNKHTHTLYIIIIHIYTLFFAVT